MMLIRAGLSMLSLPIFRVFKHQLPFLERSHMCMKYLKNSSEIIMIMTAMLMIFMVYSHRSQIKSLF